MDGDAAKGTLTSPKFTIKRNTSVSVLAEEIMSTIPA
jgi:hypothetical protein